MAEAVGVDQRFTAGAAIDHRCFTLRDALDSIEQFDGPKVMKQQGLRANGQDHRRGFEKCQKLMGKHAVGHRLLYTETHTVGTSAPYVNACFLLFICVMRGRRKSSAGAQSASESARRQDRLLYPAQGANSPDHCCQRMSSMTRM